MDITRSVEQPRDLKVLQKSSRQILSICINTCQTSYEFLKKTLLLMHEFVPLNLEPSKYAYTSVVWLAALSA